MSSHPASAETKEHRESAFSALASRFQADEFSEHVLRASLFAKGMRGDELETFVQDQLEIKHAARKGICR